MDVFDHILPDLRRRLQSLTVRQRLTGAVVAACLLVALITLLRSAGTTDLVPLSLGKQLTDAELASAETTLREQGLRNFRREGRRLLVPSDQVDAYEGALLLSGGLADTLETTWSQRLDQTSLFATRTHLQEMKDSYLSEELARMIQAIPEIEQARVRWARESFASGFRRGERRKATVFVQPRPKTALTDRLVHALRHGVANAVADLDPAHVTIFDLSAGRAYTASEDGGEIDERALRILDSYSNSLRDRIAAQLSHIPGAIVQVYVKLADPRSAFAPPSPPVDDQQSVRTYASADVNSISDDRPVRETTGRIAAAAPTHRTTFHGGQWQTLARLTEAEQDIHVSIGVPQDYYAAVVRSEGGDPSDAGQLLQTRQQIDAILKRNVGSVLSPSSRVAGYATPRTAHVQISAVANHHPVEAAPADAALLRKPAIAGAGMVLMASVAFWTVRRRRRRLVPGSRATDGEPAELRNRSDSHQPSPESTLPPQPSLKDSMVKSHAARDPQTTAHILAEWLNAGRE